jgi:uncharacterized protein YeaO (DUF488 family)
MKVKIKRITEEDDGVHILVQCLRPSQKDTPFSTSRKKLDNNNKLFQKYADEYRQEMEDYKERITLIHLGDAKLYQEGEEE